MLDVLLGSGMDVVHWVYKSIHQSILFLPQRKWVIKYKASTTGVEEQIKKTKVCVGGGGILCPANVGCLSKGMLKAEPW